MKTYYLLLSLSLLSVTSIAQHKEFRLLSGLYFEKNNTREEFFEGTFVMEQKSASIQFNAFQPGFLFANKSSGFFHEIGFVRLDFNKRDNITVHKFPLQDVIEPTDGARVHNFSTRLFYNFGWSPRYFADRKLQPKIALSFQPFLEITNYRPATSQSFPYQFLEVGTNCALLPSVEYPVFSEKLKIILQAGLPVCNFKYSRLFYENPSWSIEQQTDEDSAFKIFQSSFFINTGLAFKLE